MLSSGTPTALTDELKNFYNKTLKQLIPHCEDQTLFQEVFSAMADLKESESLPDFARRLDFPDETIIEVQNLLATLRIRGTLDQSFVPPLSECFHRSFLEFMKTRGPGKALLDTIHVD